MYVNHIRITLVIRHYGHHDLAVRFLTVLCSALLITLRAD